MENLTVSFNIIAPFMLYMLLGALFRRLEFVGGDTIKGIDRLVSTVFLPVFNFMVFIKADLSAIARGGFIFYILAAHLVLLAALMLLVKLMRFEPATAGTVVLSSFISNSMVMGLAVAVQMFEAGKYLEVVLAAASTLPFYNGLMIPIIQGYGEKQRLLDEGRAGESVTIKVDVSALLIRVLKNPLVIAMLAGLIFQLIGIELPTFADTFISGLSNLVTPLIFIALGFEFKLGNIKEDRRPLLLILLIKLFISPLVFLTLPVIWGFTGAKLLACLIAFGTPCGVTTVPLLRACGCNSRLAGEALALSSALSVFTMFLWIFAFKQMGLM